ncbi:Disease resistance protein RRS1B [Frankliniella fusca]|uniref:Disease resistance protein RRS1B n=1 Tax=Frankliniella fusca TaxID=407009 RepID=A0AAE1HC76_9NEOP|nr:Disease resistance protein RRS1B [Frankliniella fusca]
MEECPGQRDGSTIYYYDGHMYRRNRATESSTYYRCSVRGCFGRVIQKHNLGVIIQVSPHNHPADQDKHSLRRFLAAIQRRVSTETAPIFNIYQEEASRFPGIEKSMPFESLQLQMEKRRRLNESMNYPSEA